MPANPVTLVRWEPIDRDGQPWWRCAIDTGHGELSWTTRHAPGEDALTTDDLRVAAEACERVSDDWFTEGSVKAAAEFEVVEARLRAALDGIA